MNKSVCLSALLMLSPLSGVYPSAALAAHGKTYNNNVSDSVITGKIKAHYLADSVLNPLDIAVSTHNGEVSLRGRVPADAEYEKAIETAQSVDGVKDVDADDLVVNDSNRPLSDTAITAKINGILLQKKLFMEDHVSITGFSVETKNGVVYLKGELPNEKTKQHLLKIVNSVSGVKDVQDMLEVS